MANEITLQASLAVSKGSTVLSLATGLLQATFTGTNAGQYRQVIGTAEEALTIPPDVGTLGWCLIINRDATNFVSLRAGTGLGNFAKIFPGKFALFHWGSGATAPFAIADTGNCEIEVLLLEV